MEVMLETNFDGQNACESKINSVLFLLISQKVADKTSDMTLGIKNFKQGVMKLLVCSRPPKLGLGCIKQK